jgi:hypothetical protein
MLSARIRVKTNCISVLATVQTTNSTAVVRVPHMLPRPRLQCVQFTVEVYTCVFFSFINLFFYALRRNRYPRTTSLRSRAA